MTPTAPKTPPAALILRVPAAQAAELRDLSRRSRIPQSIFLREGLDYVLRRYRTAAPASG